MYNTYTEAEVVALLNDLNIDINRTSGGLALGETGFERWINQHLKTRRGPFPKQELFMVVAKDTENTTLVVKNLNSWEAGKLCFLLNDGTPREYEAVTHEHPRFKFLLE